MSDALKDEFTYDQDRLDRHVVATARATGSSRREILKGVLAMGAGSLAGFGGSTPRAFAQELPPIVKPTPPELFRTLGTNRETLFEAFKGEGLLTPASKFFIRNHTRTPRIDAATWRLRIDGSGVRSALELSYDELLALPSVTKTRFIECAGNGRSFFETQQGTRAAGTQWRLGAIGVGEWTGVPLAEILHRAGLDPAAVDVQPEGLDEVVGSDGHVRRPIPIQKALDDVLVVYGLNGHTLPEDHGFPARLLVPGWIGIANIKWAGRIEVSKEPLFSAWNTTQYRLVGDAYPEGLVITNQTVKSAFELPFPATLSPGKQLITGRAWSGRGSIRRVDVSFNDGANWVTAALDPHNEPGSWVQWSHPWSARPGNFVFKARAKDSAGNLQPLDSVPFNTNGYLFSGVVSHPVTVA